MSQPLQIQHRWTNLINKRRKHKTQIQSKTCSYQISGKLDYIAYGDILDPHKKASGTLLHAESARPAARLPRSGGGWTGVGTHQDTIQSPRRLCKALTDYTKTKKGQISTNKSNNEKQHVFFQQVMSKKNVADRLRLVNMVRGYKYWPNIYKCWLLL